MSLTRSRLRCDACKKRKVKCDQTHPTCSRCARLGKDCRYPDVLDTLIRNENSKTSARANRLWRQRTITASQGTHSSHYTTKLSLVKDNIQPMRRHREADDPPTPVALYYVPSRPSATYLHPLNGHALDLFFKDYCSSKGGHSRWQKLFLLMPEVYARQSADSLSAAIISALAFANLARREEDGYVGRHNDRGSSHFIPASDAHHLGRCEFGRCLGMINRKLCGSPEKTVDELLFAIWGLGFFEMLDPPQEGTRRARWSYHLDGAIALLRSQQAACGGGSSISDAVFNQTFGQMLIVSLINLQAPSLPLHIWKRRRKEGSPGNKLISIVHKTASLCAQLHQALKTQQKSAEDAAILLGYVQTGIELDKRLEMWDLMKPAEWSHREERMAALQGPCQSGSPEMDLYEVWTWHGAPELQHVYPSVAGAIPRTFYLSARLQLNHLLYCAIGHPSFPATDMSLPAISPSTTESESVASQGSFHSVTVEMIEHICCSTGIIASATSQLEKASSLDSLFAVFPLRIAVNVLLRAKQDGATLVDPALSEWTMRMLRYTRRNVCSGRSGIC